MIEIMIVTVIIGLLAVIAVASFRLVRMRVQNSRFISDVRIFAYACNSYSLSNGEYPADAASGEVPAGLDDYIKSSDFTAATPIGGLWDTITEESGVVFAIGAVDVTATDQQLTYLDESHDDGDITTGNFRKLGDGTYFRVLEE